MSFRTKDELKKLGYSESCNTVIRRGEDLEEYDDNVLSLHNQDGSIDEIVAFGKKSQYTIPKNRIDNLKGLVSLYRALSLDYIKLPVATKKTLYGELDRIVDDLYFEN